MEVDVEDAQLLGEVDRAIREVRATLSKLGQRRRLTPTLMSLSTLLDRVECSVTSVPGDSAFELDETGERVAFRTETLRHIVHEAEQLAGEIELEEIGIERTKQLAINLFIVHEIIHIRQNFPDFATVDKIKLGLPGIGLPLLDLAADILSSWVCAHVEADRSGESSKKAVMRHYVNCLLMAYVIGSFVYDSRTKPEKRQRMIGIIISMALVQARIDGYINEESISEGWHEIAPILALNLEKSETFNAIVVDHLPGLLLQDRQDSSDPDILRLWDHVGRKPIVGIVSLVARLLTRAGAISI